MKNIAAKILWGTLEEQMLLTLQKGDIIIQGKSYDF